jgi:hypothetical protein
MQRDFGGSKDFVRGKGNNFPFAPGGIDEALEDAVNSLAQGMLEEKHAFLDFENGMDFCMRGQWVNKIVFSRAIANLCLGSMIDKLLSIPPGFERGLLSATEHGNYYVLVLLDRARYLILILGLT